MSRPGKQQHPKWLLKLAEEARMLATVQTVRGVSAVVNEAAEKHGIEPWDLTMRIARLWKEQGHISTLTPGKVEVEA